MKRLLILAFLILSAIMLTNCGQKKTLEIFHYPQEISEVTNKSIGQYITNNNTKFSEPIVNEEISNIEESVMKEIINIEESVMNEIVNIEEPVMYDQSNVDKPVTIVNLDNAKSEVDVSEDERYQLNNMELPRLIAHAGGDYYGITLSNSISALEASYNEGFSWIELDFNNTSDGVPVCVHDWGNTNWMMYNQKKYVVPTYDQFNKHIGVLGIQMTTLNSLEEWLENHPNVYIISDVKDGNIEFLQYIKQNHGVIYRQLIPQIYLFEEYDKVYNLGYENIILTLYRITVSDEDIVEFCKSRKILAITMPQIRGMGSLPRMLEAIDVPSYAHTINMFSDYKNLRLNGIYGVYTDYFQPNNWIE